jgi:hypothetical protein
MNVSLGSSRELWISGATFVFGIALGSLAAVYVPAKYRYPIGFLAAIAFLFAHLYRRWL